MLDLDVEVYPCPKGGDRFRSVVLEKGGKSMFPFLIDPNTNKEMYESDDIVQYLFQEYGDGEVPFYLNLPQNLSATLGGLGVSLRRERGRNAQPSKAPEKPLVMYGYEPSPFVKLVREKLCELEIPYLYKNVARGSPKRQELFEKWGKFAVPYIEEPNTKIAMIESGDDVATALVVCSGDGPEDNSDLGDGVMCNRRLDKYEKDPAFQLGDRWRSVDFGTGASVR
eukprot:TRINITY_DN1621_c0_g1_i8.p3 TRINITY_DN1621_c0_g1~~TRINITY_DN1621_c0_g1_i8.p3  ORF type:complete len:225 (+),score=47.72 TRINITY_DN1621_c0_g1_i8:156-830(+)